MQFTDRQRDRQRDIQKMKGSAVTKTVTIKDMFIYTEWKVLGIFQANHLFWPRIPFVFWGQWRMINMLLQIVFCENSQNVIGCRYLWIRPRQTDINHLFWPLIPFMLLRTMTNDYVTYNCFCENNQNVIGCPYLWRT